MRGHIRRLKKDTTENQCNTFQLYDAEFRDLFRIKSAENQAVVAGRSRRTIYNWRRGKGQPSADILSDMRKAIARHKRLKV